MKQTSRRPLRGPCAPSCYRRQGAQALCPRTAELGTSQGCVPENEGCLPLPRSPLSGLEEPVWVSAEGPRVQSCTCWRFLTESPRARCRGWKGQSSTWRESRCRGCWPWCRGYERVAALCRHVMTPRSSGLEGAGRRCTPGHGPAEVERRTRSGLWNPGRGEAGGGRTCKPVSAVPDKPRSALPQRRLPSCREPEGGPWAGGLAASGPVRWPGRGLHRGRPGLRDSG